MSHTFKIEPVKTQVMANLQIGQYAIWHCQGEDRLITRIWTSGFDEPKMFSVVDIIDPNNMWTWPEADLYIKDVEVKFLKPGQKIIIDIGTPPESKY